MQTALESRRLPNRLSANEKLSPGDRVEGLGNFGKPTGEIGTVERTNEEDAVVKWNDDGCTRLHQPSLKKGTQQQGFGRVCRRLWVRKTAIAPFQS